MLTSPTLDKLLTLKLRGMADSYRLQQEQPSMQTLAFDERLAMMVDRELGARESQRLRRLITQARFRYAACIEEVDYSLERGLDRSQLMALTGGDWIRRQQNILLTGATGTGKSWMACALGYQACRQGYSVLYRNCAQLFEDLQIAAADGSLPRLRQQLCKINVLILDDLGLAPVIPVVGYTLLEIIDARSQTGSLIITSQFPSERWRNFFAEATLAEAILDRIVHRSHRLLLKGESMRKKMETL